MELLPRFTNDPDATANHQHAQQEPAVRSESPMSDHAALTSPPDPSPAILHTDTSSLHSSGDSRKASWTVSMYQILERRLLLPMKKVRHVLQPHARFPTSNTEPRAVHPTAWLDGLRGIAALLVFILHHQEYGHPFDVYVILENPWNFNGERHFVTFPFVRLMFSGGIFAVPIFFIISGYVLAHKPLQLIHAEDLRRLAQSTGSSIFRRWFRLFLPVYVATFIWMTSWYVFGYRSMAKGAPEILSSWTAEVARWWDNHNRGGYTGYNPHL